MLEYWTYSMLNTLMSYKDINKILWKLTHQSLILYELILTIYKLLTTIVIQIWNFFLLKIFC